MTFIEKLNVIERLDQLIRMKATGSPDELAQRLEVTRSTVYEIIACMKSLGADISYCKNRKSFYYETEKELAIGFVNKSMITGGKQINVDLFENILQRPNFSDKAPIYL